METKSQAAVGEAFEPLSTSSNVDPEVQNPAPNP